MQHIYINHSPVLLFSQVFIILHGHIFLHIKLRQYLRHHNLVPLRAIQVEVSCVYFPRLVFLYLPVEVKDGHVDVDLVCLGDLPDDLFHVALEGLEVWVLRGVLCRLGLALVGGRRVRFVNSEFC
jgi:hypothetical protein